MEEVVKYEHRYEEGYDIPDPRYKCWLSVYHPEAMAFNGKSDSHLPSETPVSVHSQPLCHHHGVLQSKVPCTVHHPQTLFSKFLDANIPVYKFPTKEPKNSGRILTSAESVRILQEKKRKKDKEAEEKEQRKRARELKVLEKKLWKLKRQGTVTEGEIFFVYLYCCV